MKLKNNYNKKIIINLLILLITFSFGFCNKTVPIKCQTVNVMPKVQLEGDGDKEALASYKILCNSKLLIIRRIGWLGCGG